MRLKFMEERGKAKGFLHKMTNLTMMHSRSKASQHHPKLLQFVAFYVWLPFFWEWQCSSTTWVSEPPGAGRSDALPTAPHGAAGDVARSGHPGAGALKEAMFLERCLQIPSDCVQYVYTHVYVFITVLVCICVYVYITKYQNISN